ncbi:MAG: hypothetical protein R3F48_09935 [Candidatus Zixiibacteriota bacterium]
MFGFLGVFGPQAREFSETRIRSLWHTDAKCRFLAPISSVSVGLFVPKNHAIDSFISQTEDNALTLAVPGYILTHNSRHGLQAHIAEAASRIAEQGFEAAMQGLAGGCYNALAWDQAGKSFHIAVDPVGTIPIYYVRCGETWLISNNPVALCRSGMFTPSIDEIGASEWALFSYALGNRYPIRQIRTLRMGEYFRWQNESGSIHSYSRLWDRLPYEKTPPVEQIAEEIKAACVRLSRIDNRPAQLQSSGFDSRLISAAWPQDSPLHCYTYGNPNAHEISIAKRIAEHRGALWSQTWQHGDELADALDGMFNASGIVIWPDHYFVAARQADNGFIGTLNGLGGDPLIGDTYLSYTHYLGKNLAMRRVMCRFYDLSVKELGVDAIAEAMYQSLCQVDDIDALRDFLDDGRLEMVRKAKPDILQDIRRELDYVQTGSDSLALLWRNCLYANRIPNMVSQQMIMLLQHVLVYCPITNDAAFHDLAFRLPAGEIAYYRLYRRLYRHCFPEFAAIPYGNTLIPISRPLWNHKIAAVLLNKGISVPLLTNPANGKPRDPNSWALWMRESERLRDYLSSILVNSGVSDQSRLSSYMSDIAGGRRLGGGKIFHVLSLAKWMELCKQ